MSIFSFTPGTTLFERMRTAAFATMHAWANSDPTMLALVAFKRDQLIAR
jgi:hypothetical protein